MLPVFNDLEAGILEATIEQLNIEEHGAGRRKGGSRAFG